MAKGPNWTSEEEERLRELLDAHRPYAEIAERLQRGEGAVRRRCAVLGLSVLTANRRTVRGTARLLGVDDKTVTRWLEKGYLRGYAVGSVGRGIGRVIEHDELLAFMEREEHWQRWEPGRIKDMALREWAKELRNGVRYLTTAEAGQILCLTHYAVSNLVREGKIRAVKKHNNWLIRSDHLHYPERTPQRRPQRVTDEERALIRRFYGKRPAIHIARAIGRSHDSTVHKVAAELGLPRIGRGYWKRQAVEKRAKGEV